MLVLLIALVFGIVPPAASHQLFVARQGSEAEAVQPEAPSVSCPSCTGSGRVEAACAVCSGERKLSCPACRPRPKARAAESDDKKPRALLEMEKMIAEYERLRERVDAGETHMRPQLPGICERVVVLVGSTSDIGRFF